MQPLADSRGTAPPGPTLNGVALLRIVNGDVALLGRLVEVFREGNPKALADIRAAVSRGDTGELRRSAHALAGTISNFSTDEAFQAARELERLGAGGQAGTAEMCAGLEEAVRRLEEALVGLVAAEGGGTR